MDIFNSQKIFEIETKLSKIEEKLDQLLYIQDAISEILFEAGLIKEESCKECKRGGVEL